MRAESFRLSKIDSQVFEFHTFLTILQADALMVKLNVF
jgi:hypothetical protein